MIETAEIVAERYGISRAAQDEYSLESQKRTAAAQTAGRHKDEIASHHGAKTTLRQRGQANRETIRHAYLDEGNRPDTTLEGLASLKPVWKDGPLGETRQVHHGGQCVAAFRWRGGRVVMNRVEAQKRKLPVLGIYPALRSAGCNPDEMGIGPVFRDPKLLAKPQPESL